MHLAAKSGNVDVLKALLTYGVNLCPTNVVKDTPLHVSIRNGHTEFSLMLIDRLIKSGVGPDQVDIENDTEKLTPYFIAVLNGMTTVADRLVSVRYAKKDRVNSLGKTIEDLANEYFSTKACTYLGLPLPDPIARRQYKQNILRNRFERL